MKEKKKKKKAPCQLNDNICIFAHACTKILPFSIQMKEFLFLN